MPKTLFLFQDSYFEPKFLELEGDYSHLDKTYINLESLDDMHQEKYTKCCDELTELIYDLDGTYKVTFLDKPTKDWDYYVECGCMP